MVYVCFLMRCKFAHMNIIFTAAPCRASGSGVYSLFFLPVMNKLSSHFTSPHSYISKDYCLKMCFITGIVVSHTLFKQPSRSVDSHHGVADG